MNQKNANLVNKSKSVFKATNYTSSHIAHVHIF